MFSETTAVPWWSRTTTDLENFSATITTCCAEASVPWPVSSTLTSPSTSTSAGTVMTVASVKFSQAFAETRSSGMAAEPIRRSSRPTVSTLTLSGAVTRHGRRAAPVRTSVCRPRRRLSGVKRQSSSMPVSGLKSASL